MVADADGNFYGTTYSGGIAGCAQDFGCGTVFKIAPDGSEAIVYKFQGGSDGAAPFSSLILDKMGNLYGTTSAGGGSGCNGGGCGTVFKIAPDGTETILHAFQGGSDGAVPYAAVIADQSGNLFGTTSLGGDPKHFCTGQISGCGTVFELAPDRTETLLKVFDVRHEHIPRAGLVADNKGNLYGSTSAALRYSGVIFEISQP